jgi:VWFA-related protein
MRRNAFTVRPAAVRNKIYGEPVYFMRDDEHLIGLCRTLCRLTLTLLCLSLVSGLLLASQAPGPVFKSETDLQSVPVRVVDKQGKDVTGLGVNDFTLLEDGHPAKIAFFAAEHQPISLAILVDTSNSMSSSEKIGRIQSVLTPLLHASRPDDEVFLMQFTNQVGPLETLTAEQRLNPPLAAVTSTRGGTALYDALATALCRLEAAKNPQRAIVVVTDGVDQNSRLTFQQLLNFAQSSRPQIFMIGFFSAWESDLYRDRSKPVLLVSGRHVDNPLVAFDRLAKESGAVSFFPTSQQGLGKSLNKIANILRAQYTLAYYPENAGQRHDIEVRVKHKGYKVTTRRSIGAETGGDKLVHFITNSCEVSAKEHPYPWEPLVTETAGKTLLYRDDFSNPKSGWPDRNGSRYQSGSYELLSKGRSNATLTSAVAAELGMGRMGEQLSTAAGSAGVIAANGPWWENFRASASIGGGGGLAADGLVFHLNERGYYAFLVTDAGRANEISFKLVKQFFGGFNEAILIPWTDLALPAVPGGRKLEHRVSVECNRGEITLRIDGQLAKTIHDATFSNGLVGFALFGDGHVEFRDLRAESLP